MQFARLERCWPSLRSAGIFQVIFSQNQGYLSTYASSTSTSSSSSAVCDVWVASGHVILALRQSAVVLALDVVPASLHLTELGQQMLAQTLQAPVLTDFTTLPESLSGTLLSAASSPAVQVFWTERPAPSQSSSQSASSFGLGSGPGSTTTTSNSTALPNLPSNSSLTSNSASPNPTLWIVRENGGIEGWKFNRKRSTWSKAARAKLPSDRTVQIREALFERNGPGDSAIFTYAEMYIDKKGAEVCDVSVMLLQIDESTSDQTANISWSLATPRVLLRAIPPVSIVSIEGGIAFLPRQRTPVTIAATTTTENLCYFWSYRTTNTSVLSLVWGRSPFALGDDSPASANGSQDLPLIVAHSVHPVTRELIILDNRFTVSVCALIDGHFYQRVLIQLKHNDQFQEPRGIVEVAYYRLFIIIFDDKAYYMYSLHSGQLVSVFPYPVEAIDRPVHVWQSSGPTSKLGIWTHQGIWQLQHTRVTDMLSSAPGVTVSKGTESTSIASESAKWREDAIFSAHMWSLDRYEAKHLLNAAFVLSNFKSSEVPDNAAAKAALSLLQNYLIESPALVIALLDAFPTQRRHLHSLLTTFINDYDGTSSNQLEGLPASMRSFRVRTPHNQQLKGLIDEYVSMLEQNNNDSMPVLMTFASDATPTAAPSTQQSTSVALMSPPSESNMSPTTQTTAPAAQLSQSLSDALFILRGDVAEEIVAILDRGASRFRISKTPNESSEDRARLETLCMAFPRVALEAIERFLHLKEYDEASVPDGDELAMLDYFFKEETLQEISIRGKSVRSSRILLFELLTPLITQLKPGDLEAVILFAHSCTMKALSIRTKAGFTRTNNTRLWRRDSLRALDTFRRRALQVIVPPDPSVVLSWLDPNASIRAISTLLVSVEEAPTAVRFLLSLQRWEEAITLVSELMNGDRDIVEHVELFHTLFSTILESGQITRDILDRLWEVVPRNYSIYDLLTLLRTVDPSASVGDIVTAEPILTIGMVRPQLIKLMNRELRKRPL